MGSSPKPPDPYKQADAQNQQNYYAAMMNSYMGNANQVNPYGSVSSNVTSQNPIYGKGGKVEGYAPQFTQTTTLSPAQQAIFDKENAAKLGFADLATRQIGQLTSTLGKPFDTSGLQAWGTYGKGPDLRYETGDTNRTAIEDAMMASYRRGTAPGQAAEDAQLAARGMGAPGSDYGYKVQQGREDAAGEAARQAYLASGGESRAATEAANKAIQQNWLNANTRVDQGNQLRQAQFGERQQLRNQIVNEAAALMGGGQATVPQGQAWSGGQVNPFDISGAMDRNYQYQQQNYGNKMAGIFGLAGNALKMVNPFSMFGKGTGMIG